MIRFTLRALFTLDDEERTRILARAARLRGKMVTAVELGLAVANVELRRELEKIGVVFDGTEPSEDGEP